MNKIQENTYIKQNLPFENLLEGFILAEMIFDEKGQPIDYRIFEFHTSSQINTDLKDSHQKMRELFDSINCKWVEIFGNAVQLGKQIKFERYSEDLNRWFKVQAYSLSKNHQFIAIFEDITEFKNAKKEHQKNIILESEIEKYRSILNSMDESFGIIEMIFDTVGKPVDWRYLEVNPMHEICFGLKNVEGKLISQLARKTNKKLLDIYGKVALTGKPVRIVEGVFGEKSCYDLYALKIGGQDSRKVAVFAYDITERKKNEERLTFQANLLSSVHDAIAAVDEDDIVTYWNEMAEKMFGWSAQEAIGLAVGELKTSKGTVRFEIPNLFKDGYYIGELYCRRKDGMIITTDVHSKVLLNDKGEYKGSVGSFRDITERKQKEKELQAVKESLAAEVEALNKLHSLSNRFILKDNLQTIYGEILDAAIELTQADKGSIHIFNEQTNCLEILEQRSHEPLFLNRFNHIPIEGRTVASKAFKDRKRIIVEDVSQTTIYIEADRWAIWGAGIQGLQGTPLISSSGNIVGILITGYMTSHQFEERELRMLDLLARQAADTIERIRAEETIQESEKRALALVEELRKMDQNKNKFLNMLSHELRNPLASIMMSLSLQNQVPPGGQEDLKARKVMGRQTAHLSRLVDDLLDVSRITQNKITLKKERVELNQLVKPAVADYQASFTEKEVGLKIELTSDLLYLEADPARLTQVIGNLLHNATKFTSKGDQVLVKVCQDEITQEAIIEVKDNGIGIIPELLLHLFEPFMQVDSTLDRSNGGLGLGLAIVKGMVELHDGSVSIFSEGLGKGTQLTIRLPLTAVEDGKKEQGPKTGGLSAITFRILIIDDIPDIAEILSSLLRYLGHEVITACSGPEGIAKAKEFHPEVVICDIGLPGMNGYEVAKSLRSDKELKDRYLIALSGYAQLEDLERSREAGFNTHLAKPVNLDTLEQVLAKLATPPIFITAMVSACCRSFFGVMAWA
jgi:PAS domain S-box-containing protein